MTTEYFTFGQEHMTSWPLPHGGRLADYWVEVTLPKGRTDHRDLFVERFTSVYCPRPMQFATSYSEKFFKRFFFPKGCLVRITEAGFEEI